MGMKKQGVMNNIKMLLFTAALGAFAGAVVWAFLKAVGALTGAFRTFLPGGPNPWIFSFILCAAGGLALGLIHKRFGYYPEDMKTVMAKVKKEKYYDYKPLPVILICAFIPLVLGASVGPEAGLVGIIAAICYWIGDNVTYARKHEREYSRIGEAVTLGQLFHSPLFGIFAVEESAVDEEKSDSDKDEGLLPKGERILYYAVSLAASFLAVGILNKVTGLASGGFPHYPDAPIEAVDYVMMLVYIPVGILLCLWFAYCEKLTGKAAEKIPGIVREVIGGLVIAAAGMLIPLALFSGEEQMAELMDTYGLYLPIFLIVVCIIKIALTGFCIRFGWRGGHFFPLIFACSCMGFAIAMFVFPDAGNHVVFAAAIVNAATMGASLKKPLAAALLLMLCFPVTMIFWILLASVAGSFIMKRIEGAMSRRRAEN